MRLSPHNTLQRLRAGDGERMSQGLYENSRRENEAGETKGKVAEARRGEGAAGMRVGVW